MIVFYLLFALLATAQIDISKPVGGEEATTPVVAYASDRLIVKFKDTLTVCAADLFATSGSFKLATTDSSDSLDQLFANWKVSSVTPLFRTESERKTIRGRSKVAKLAQFPLTHNKTLPKD